MINHDVMKYLPIQSRADIATQVELEGSLVANDGNAPISNYASTGSTGTPVKIYVCQQNKYYNSTRSLAQYFINHLVLQKTKLISPATSWLARKRAISGGVDCGVGRSLK